MTIVHSVTTLSLLAWVMSLLLIGIVTSTAVAARRHEIGVQWVLGATRITVIQSLLTKSLDLVLAGSIVGITIAVACIYLFRNLIMHTSPNYF